MKSLFLVLLVLVVVAKANHMHEGEGSGSGVGDETGVGALSCEAKEGCCEDALDCPGCCNPPYDNQCANIKGVSMNFCEITGTYFITGSSLDYQKYNLSQCPSANMAGNYPGQCQGTLTLNSKIRKLDLTGKPIAPYVPQPPAFVQIIRYAACGHVVVSINLDPRSNFAQLAEPFLYNAAIVARNEAGLAVVVCYAIYKAPIFFAMVASPTPKPNPYQFAELQAALEPYYTTPTGHLYPVNYADCYPSLKQFGYVYY